MQIRTGIASVSPTATLALTATLLAFPAPSHAADIAWHSKGESTVWNGANYERKGTLDFKTGERATFVQYGTNHAMDGKGSIPSATQYVLRFDDLSSITLSVKGKFDPASQATKVSGDILGGTGRFEGIAGTVTGAGQFSGGIVETDWDATYSLPAASRGFQQ